MFRKHPTGLLIAAVMALILITTGFFIWRFLATQRVPATQASSLLIVRQSSGGLSGKGDGHNLRIDSKTLNAAQQSTLLSQVNAANFFALSDTYTDDECADSFTTTITITLPDRGKAITFDKCSEAVPEALRTFDTYLRRNF